MYEYFVSYFYTNKNGSYGVGNTFVKSSDLINSEQLVREVEKKIRGEEMNGLALINFQLLKMTESEV